MTNKEKLTYYYRWQFLRLNKGYQAYYKMCVKGVKALEKDKHLSDIEKQQALSRLENDIHKMFGINGIYDYKEKKVPVGLRIYGKADLPVKRGSLTSIFGNKIAENQEIRGNVLLETISRKKKTKNKQGKIVERNVPLITPKYVQVVVNYDAELGDIHREIDRIVKSNQKLRREELGIKRAKTRNKAAKEDYDNYLRVWNLRNKGMKNNKIAKKIFPKQDARSAEDKTSKYYTQALKLINGGYRNINF